MNFQAALIIAGLMVVAILFLMAMFAQLYRKAGPHEALVVYGFRGTRIIKGRGSVILRSCSSGVKRGNSPAAKSSRLGAGRCMRAA